MGGYRSRVKARIFGRLLLSTPLRIPCFDYLMYPVSMNINSLGANGNTEKPFWCQVAVRWNYYESLS